MGLLGSIGKFLVGGKKKGDSAKATSTTSGTTDIDPYAPTVAPIQSYLDKIGALYNGGAPQFSDLETKGYGALESAADGSTLAPAIAQNNKTINGDYLTPDTNPYLADIAKRISGIAGSTTAGMFGGKGRTGSGLAGHYAGKAVGDSLTDLYGSEYNTERGLQQSAVAQAPGLDQARYVGPSALISAGQNVSARPFDLASQQGGLLTQIANVGKQGTTTGQADSTTQQYHQSNGLLGDIFNSFTNKLFGTTRGTG